MFYYYARNGFRIVVLLISLCYDKGTKREIQDVSAVNWFD